MGFLLHFGEINQSCKAKSLTPYAVFDGAVIQKASSFQKSPDSHRPTPQSNLFEGKLIALPAAHDEIKITPAATFILTADSSTQHRRHHRADLLRGIKNFQQTFY